jgi:hypothetical protein
MVAFSSTLRRSKVQRFRDALSVPFVADTSRPAPAPVDPHARRASRAFERFERPYVWAPIDIGELAIGDYTLKIDHLWIRIT